jgi:hypothetical protein
MLEDGTGPAGLGLMNGRGLGHYAGYSFPGSLCGSGWRLGRGFEYPAPLPFYQLPFHYLSMSGYSFPGYLYDTGRRLGRGFEYPAPLPINKVSFHYSYISEIWGKF